MSKIIIANWKMNFVIKESISFIKKIKPKISKTKNKIIICPSFTSLEKVGSLIKGSKIKLGAQNIAQEKEGTWTGEVSAKMIKEAGCKYVIIGHSERRHKLGETNSQINSKIKIALENNIIPIFCVGETRKERKAGQTNNVITKQLKEGLRGVNGVKQLIIAYEPVWAISDGNKPNITPKIEEIETVHKLIKNDLTKHDFYPKIYSSFKTIYGGSVAPNNINELLNSSLIDGVLVGGASLKNKEIIKISNMET